MTKEMEAHGEVSGAGNLIERLMADQDVVAVVLKQKLAPVEGDGVPFFPPTFPKGENTKSHRHDTPYSINKTKDGVLICDVDTVQAEANRMEAAFANGLADLVPQHAVRVKAREGSNYPNPAKALTDLKHRGFDAVMRSTEMANDIKEMAMEYEVMNNPVPLAKFNPTMPLYGGWDSRETQVKIARAVRSTIIANDVSVFTRSAQFTGNFTKEELDLTEAEWGDKGAAKAGLAPVPSVDQHGGILAHGEIVHTASIALHALRKYRAGDDGAVLPNYLFGLALAALVESCEDYHLRSGCFLLPDAPAEWFLRTRRGEWLPIEVDKSEVLEAAREVAREWSEWSGVKLGGEPTIHDYDPAKAKAMIKGANKEAKKEKGEAR